jgi:hypothetical protein
MPGLVPGTTVTGGLAKLVGPIRAMMLGKGKTATMARQSDAQLDELLREEVRKSMADKRPSVSIYKVFKRAKARIARKAKAAARSA